MNELIIWFVAVGCIALFGGGAWLTRREKTYTSFDAFVADHQDDLDEIETLKFLGHTHY